MIQLTSNIIEDGFILGFTVACLLTLLKSIIERLDINDRYLDMFLRSCNSCSTFWIVLILSFNVYISAIGWVASLLIEYIKKE